jgi:TrmH family RNA methyltransferase
MSIITSSSNQHIKLIKSLKDKKTRNEKGLFFIEGTRFFEEALSESVLSQVEIVDVFISENISINMIMSEIEKYKYTKKLNIHTITEKIYKDISDTQSPQGILATIKIKKWTINDILNRGDLILILESIQDPGNLGTIIRTADAAGFSGIIASKGTVDLYNPKVLRSTMGSVFRMPYYQTDELKESCKELKNVGIKIYGTHLDAKCSIYEANLNKNVAIIVGNEGAGMSGELMNICDSLIKIKMLGRTESLNASVAAGIVVYESLRQRLFHRS